MKLQKWLPVFFTTPVCCVACEDIHVVLLLTINTSTCFSLPAVLLPLFIYAGPSHLVAEPSLARISLLVIHV